MNKCSECGRILKRKDNHDLGIRFIWGTIVVLLGDIFILGNISFHMYVIFLSASIYFYNKKPRFYYSCSEHGKMTKEVNGEVKLT